MLLEPKAAAWTAASSLQHRDDYVGGFGGSLVLSLALDAPKPGGRDHPPGAGHSGVFPGEYGSRRFCCGDRRRLFRVVGVARVLPVVAAVLFGRRRGGAGR